MMLGMFIFVFRQRKKRWGTFWQVNGPSVLVGIAFFLVLADPSRHVLQDQGVWTSESSNEYSSTCSHGHYDEDNVWQHDESFYCLTATGWGLTICCTYTGFFLLMLGTMWNANMYQTCVDIKYKWQAIRNNEEEESFQGEEFQQENFE